MVLHVGFILEMPAALRRDVFCESITLLAIGGSLNFLQKGALAAAILAKHKIDLARAVLEFAGRCQQREM